MKKSLHIAIILITASLFWYCTDKFDMPVISKGNPGNIGGDTIYIQQNPVWTGFNKPQDLIIGKEPFLYVCDTDNDRVVMMNLAGEILGTRYVQKPVAIAQDHLLNLIVCGELVHEGQVYSAVFKIHLFDSHHDLASAKIDTLLPKTSFDFARPDRKFTGVTTFYDNSFYVARTGPVNSSPVDPDNSILIFKLKELSDGSKKDTLIGRVPLIEPEGSGVVSANGISSLTSFNRNNIDIIVTLTGENNSFKTQWLEYIVTPLFSGYISRLEPFTVDMMKVNKFGQPEDACLDDKNNIFVADAEKDSIFKFNSFGDEMESFGGPDVFNSPHAVAYHDRILYVADTENNRILRFILSTEID